MGCLRMVVWALLALACTWKFVLDCNTGISTTTRSGFADASRMGSDADDETRMSTCGGVGVAFSGLRSGAAIN